MWNKFQLVDGFTLSSFSGKNKSNPLSTLIWRKICLIGNFAREKIGGHEEHMKNIVVFSPKCFHSLNKFNKTSPDWQETALPQCLLFALTFLVSSCAPFLNEMKAENLRCTHTHTINSEQVGLLYKSPQHWMCYSWHSVILCHWEFSGWAAHTTVTSVSVHVCLSPTCCEYLNQSVTHSFFKSAWVLNVWRCAVAAERCTGSDVRRTLPVAASCFHASNKRTC